jgi:hypothetical protein
MCDATSQMRRFEQRPLSLHFSRMASFQFQPKLRPHVIELMS